MSPIPFNPELPAVRESLERAAVEARSSRQQFGNLTLGPAAVRQGEVPFPNLERPQDQVLENGPDLSPQFTEC